MLKIKNMNLNNVIRQGDAQARQYQLDTGNLDLNLTNKSATIRLMTADFQGIGYETTATVSSENKISFSIDDVIPARQYRLEVTVDDYVFPSRATDGQFSIDPSSHGLEVEIIRVVGKDEIVRDVKEQVEGGLQPFLGEITQAELARQEAEGVREEQEEARETAEGERQEEYQKYGQQFTDVITELTEERDFDSAPEIVAARRGKASLGEKIDEVDRQLAQKANDSIVRKKSVPITLNDVGSDIIGAIEDGEGATFNLQSIPRFSSVSSEHTTFIETSSNIIDEKKIEKGKNISSTTGELVESTNTNVTDFVPVTPSDTLIGNGLNYVYYYTYDKVYLSRESLTNNTTFSPPTDANYARFIVTNGSLNVFQINRGSVLLPYEKYWVKLNEGVGVPLSESVSPDSIGTLEIKKGAVTKANTDFLLPSSNLFNKKTAEIGKAISIDGSIINHDNYVISDFIIVDNNSTYISSPIAYVAVYDQSKTFITRLSGAMDGSDMSITLPPDAYFIRLSLNINSPYTNLDEVHINEGSILLPFEEFGYRFDDEILIDSEKDSTGNDNEKEIKYTINGVLDKYYEQVRLLPARVRQETDDIYAYYDDLMSEYPHYISKEEIGRSVEDRPIYKYSLTLTPVQSPNVAIPKIILTSAIHGVEYMSVETLKHFVNNLVRYWSEDESLETLRWNVEFDIVPLVNPDRFGFDRLNANGVDLNRQFPENWKLTDTSGSEPLTEPEAIALYNMINSTENIIYYCDGHNFSPKRSEEKKWQLLWINAGTDFNIKHANALMRTVSQKWKQQYSFLPQDETTLFGYVTKISEGGTVVEYVSSLGVEASVFESSHAIDEYDPDDGNYGPKSVSMFTEAFTNWVLINLRNNIRL